MPAEPACCQCLKIVCQALLEPMISLMRDYEDLLRQTFGSIHPTLRAVVELRSALEAEAGRAANVCAVVGVDRFSQVVCIWSDWWRGCFVSIVSKVPADLGVEHRAFESP